MGARRVQSETQEKRQKKKGQVTLPLALFTSGEISLSR